MVAWQNPVIVVPGITASTLRDEYPVGPETVWSILSRDYRRIALHPDDLRFERDEPARVAADAAFDIPYGELVREIRHDLTRKTDEPTPVYPFAYDWRQPLDQAEARLEAFVAEVIDRTKLMRHYHDAGYAADPKVDLVGHSMGGMIIAGLLQRRKQAARVGRVVSLGTPFRGSHEAVLKVATGLAAIGPERSSSRERETARLTPALYHLTPSFDGAVQADAGLPSTLFDVKAWQPGIIDTVAEYLRLYGLDKKLNAGQRRQKAEDLLKSMLDQADAHRRRLESLKLADAGLTDADWLCIVGAGERTRVRLHIRSERGKPAFDLTSDDRLNEWKNDNPNADRTLTGDGTVPYLGARCSFVSVERVVCVTDDDFGYWEWADRTIEGLVGLHGLLPKMNLVHRLIVSHLMGKPRPGTWGRRPPDLPPDAAWNPPIAKLEEKVT